MSEFLSLYTAPIVYHGRARRCRCGGQVMLQPLATLARRNSHNPRIWNAATGRASGV